MNEIKAVQKLGMIEVSGLASPTDVRSRYVLLTKNYATNRMDPVPFASVRNGKLYVPIPCWKRGFHWDEYADNYGTKVLCEYPTSPVNLRDYQRDAASMLLNDLHGMLVAPAGSGKTVIAVEVVRRRSVSTIIIVPTIDIAEQWVARFEEHLAITPAVLGGGKDLDSGDRRIIVATYQSAIKRPEVLLDRGMIIVDEAHRTPCHSIRDILNLCPAAFRHGLTATPWRADGLHRAFDWMFGPRRVHVEREHADAHLVAGTVQQILTGCAFAGFTDHNDLQEMVASHDARNRMLSLRIVSRVEEGHKVLALGQRLEQLDNVRECLGHYADRTATITGSTPASEREQILSDLRDPAGRTKILLATYQLAAEGLDVPQLSALVMLAPIGNPTKTEQAVGRIARPAEGKPSPVVLDPIDEGGMLVALARKRARVYEQIGWTVTV